MRDHLEHVLAPGAETQIRLPHAHYKINCLALRAKALWGNSYWLYDLRLKNYLRTTMAQERLNHLMILHVHKERTDNLDLKSVLNDFVNIETNNHGVR